MVAADIDTPLLRELVGDQGIFGEEEMGDASSELSELSDIERDAKEEVGRKGTGRPNFIRAATGAGRRMENYFGMATTARRLARGASADGSDRGGPGVLPDGSLAALRRKVRIEAGPAYCPTARSQRFGGWPGDAVPGDGSLDNCLTGKIR